MFVPTFLFSMYQTNFLNVLKNRWMMGERNKITWNTHPTVQPEISQSQAEIMEFEMKQSRTQPSKLYLSIIIHTM